VEELNEARAIFSEEHSILLETRGSITKDLKHMDDEVAKLKHELGRLQRRNETGNKDVAALNRGTANYLERSKDIEEKNAELEGKVNDAKKDNDDIHDEIKEVIAGIENVDEGIAIARERGENLKSDITDSRREAARDDKEIHTLTRKIEDCEYQTSNAGKSLKDVTISLENVEKKIEEIKEGVDGAATKLAIARCEREEQVEKAKDLADRLDDKEHYNKLVITDVRALNDEYNQLNHAIPHAEDQLSILHNNIDKLKYRMEHQKRDNEYKLEYKVKKGAKKE
jgi:chromosome segregation ATPase